MSTVFDSTHLKFPRPAWLREPLLHFVALGALLFCIDYAFATHGAVDALLRLGKRSKMGRLWKEEAVSIQDGPAAAASNKFAFTRSPCALVSTS
jgi:hypothetical protein